MEEKSSKRYDALIIAAILISSAFFYYFTAALPQPTNDDIYYMSIAYSLISGGPLFKAYPFFVAFGVVFPLALLYKAFGFNMLTGIYYQIFLTLVSTLLVYKIASLYSRYSGVIAAAIFAFLPAVAGTANAISPDMFTLMCALAAVLALLIYRRRHTKRLKQYAMLILSGFFAFATTFGNFMGYVFIAFYLLATAYIMISEGRGRLFLLVLLGIGIGFLLSVPPDYIMASNIELLSIGNTKYPFLAANWYLFRFFVGAPPSAYRISINPYSFFSNLTSTLLLTPSEAANQPVVTEFVWPYAYGALFYLAVISSFLLFRYKKIKAQGFFITWAAFMGLPQLFIALMMYNNSVVYYFSSVIENITAFRFELLLVTPIVIVCSYALSLYLEKANSKKNGRQISYAIVIALLIVMIATSIYSTLQYSQKLSYTTNTAYYGIQQMAVELHELNASASEGIYLPSVMEPFVTGEEALMAYSTLYGVNPASFKQLPNNCTEIPSNSYVILANTAIDPNFFVNAESYFRNCPNVVKIYNTSYGFVDYYYTLYEIR